MRLDHVAFLCSDAAATHRFYSEVLGLSAVGELVYALPGGGMLAFSEGKPHATAAEDWLRQHIGLTVATRAELEAWMRKLEQLGVRYQLADNERIYFADPDGLVLELEVAETQEL